MDKKTNQAFINDLQHIETMLRPDYVYENSPRDIQYRRLNVADNDLAGRVPVKPYPEDNVLYINTAHLMSGDEAICGVPTLNGSIATPEDFAFRNTGNVDANSNIPQNYQNVNTNLSMAYGESDLANRTRREMLADSLEWLGNTLEGAQTNITCASAKDLGIESADKTVENVRRN